jgi:hypothetical protein
MINFINNYEKENRVIFSDINKNILLSITSYGSPSEEYYIYRKLDYKNLDIDYDYQELKFIFFFMTKFTISEKYIKESIINDENIMDMICLVSTKLKNVQSNYSAIRKIILSILFDKNKNEELLLREDNKLDIGFLNLIVNGDDDISLLIMLENKYGKEIYKGKINIHLKTPCALLLDHIDSNNIEFECNNLLEINGEEFKKVINILGYNKIVDILEYHLKKRIDTGKLKLLTDKFFLVDNIPDNILDRIFELVLNYHHNDPIYFNVYNVLINKGANIKILIDRANYLYKNNPIWSNIGNKFIHHMEQNGVGVEIVFKLLSGHIF